MTVTRGVAYAGPSNPGCWPTPPDPEVPECARRRQFTAADTLRIVEEVDGCPALGQLGTLPCRKGLSSSHLVEWRRQRAQGTLAALAPRRRGRPAPSANQAELTHVRHENECLTHQLAAAEAIVKSQNIVSALLALTQPSADDGGRR